MPRKIRELKSDPIRAGFRLLKGRGKGSHTVWAPPGGSFTLTLSGADGDDAQAYQERDVRRAIVRVQKPSAKD